MSTNLPQPNAFSRRQFLTTAAFAATALCASHPLLAMAGTGSKVNRQRVSLSGDWQAAKEGSDEWFVGKVPGCIHTDLLALGKIEDPFYRNNEKTVKWVSETSWVYKRSFTVPEELLRRDGVNLCCQGLDTFAAIKINGQEIGRADNMFRTWEFDVKPALKIGENVIEVLLTSPMGFIEEHEKDRKLHKGVTGRAWLRKEPCSFGWDWAPNLPSSGIWREISIEAFDFARLTDVLIVQDHSVENQVGLNLEIQSQLAQSCKPRAVVTVTFRNKTVAHEKLPLVQGKGRTSLTIKHPKLWWPAGMGEQPLYEVKVELLDGHGKSLDVATRRIGLRTLKVIEKDTQTPLHFEVNGIPFFAKGANWIPADAFACRVTPERLRQYVVDAVAVNMNMLRFWGGGYYEEDALFDACDELGICVWLDFKFACASYPAFDDGFMENVRQEAHDNMRRLRHHPCIAVWCGNNEITFLVKDDWSEFSMAREGYEKMFKTQLGGIVKELSPDANYVTGSPDCGDVHYWDVWWGARTFEAYRELSGFLSEFGYQSYPEPKTVRSYTSKEDRESTMTDVMLFHQRCSEGNTRIKNMTGNYFREPKDFESTLWVSQLVQGYGVKLGAEYWRQNMPKSMGCLYWQYNDCWPVASWSSVDYFGRWKALHYLARRFYAPMMISGIEDSQKKTVDVFVVSDCLQAEKATLRWHVSDLSGKVLDQNSFHCEVLARCSRRALTLDLSEHCKKAGTSELLVWLDLEVNGKVISENLVTFERPKNLNLQNPGLKAEILEVKEGYEVTLSSEKPALYAWLSMDEFDATYSENFVNLDGVKVVKILVKPAKSINKEAFAGALCVKSLFDTYVSA